MNPAEAVMLVRYVRALCPQQKFDEYTPDAWYDVLSEHDFEACKAACLALSRRQPFIAPAEIVEAVRMERRPRLENFRYEPEDPDESPRDYLRRLRAQLADFADGRREPMPVLTTGPGEELAGVLKSVGKRIPDGDDL